MVYKYLTNPDGFVVVDGLIPKLSVSSATQFRTKVMKWYDLVAIASTMYGVPASWILGTIWAESLGNPSIVSFDGGHGLMQLTHSSLFGTYPKASTVDNAEDPNDNLIDASINITLGTKYLAQLQASLGNDLPKVASGYNAGLAGPGQPHPSSSSPWGMRETTGHIMRVVLGANTAIAEIDSKKNYYTNQYVKKWQKDLKLTDDGKFGPKTLASSRALLPK